MWSDRGVIVLMMVLVLEENAENVGIARQRPATGH
jgi:hypothetical protein